MKRSRIVRAPVNDGDITDVLAIGQGDFTIPDAPVRDLTPAKIAAVERATNRKVLVAAERRWRLIAYALQCLPTEQVMGILASPMPPTLGEVIEMGRKRAQDAGKCCAGCGLPLPVDRVARPKKRRNPKSVYGYKRGAR